MKKSDWIFLGVCVAVALAVYHLFIKPTGVFAAIGSSGAPLGASKATGTNLPNDPGQTITGGNPQTGIYGLDY